MNDTPFLNDPYDPAPSSLWPPECFWCGESIKGAPFIDEFLCVVFGYVYCAVTCRDDHVFSK